MYEIHGQQNNEEPTLVATPRTASEALTHYRAAQNLFRNITVRDPDGVSINGFELGRRATAEAQRMYSDRFS